jgi:hypothetical protein
MGFQGFKGEKSFFLKIALPLSPDILFYSKKAPKPISLQPINIIINFYIRPLFLKTVKRGPLQS